jgi:phage major head subunit gpT-like protein
MNQVPANWPDILDKRFTRIYNDRFKAEPDRIAEFYQTLTGTQQTERFSTVGTIGDLEAFSGMIGYGDVFQGYDVSVTPVQFAKGLQIERTLVEDDQFNIMDQKPKALAASASRTRQTHAARPFNNAFSVDTYFSTNTEGVAMCSNSHTTTSGASTATGFDNLVTTGLSAVAVGAARTQMMNFRGDQSEIISMMPSVLLVPEQGNMHETAWEIVNSMGKPDSANNNANFYKDMFTVKSWIYLTDANNWFMLDMPMLKDIGLKWVERVKPEFGFVEDFDTIVAKYRVYGRWANGWVDWRPTLGAQVS